VADEATVSAADIARLAGVGRAAVSNWRRRHPDFPVPVGGTATSPLFALAEVEGWLRAQGKLAEVPLAERAWQEVRAEAGDDLHLAAAIARAGDLLVRQGHGMSAVAELATRQGPAGAFEFLLDRYQETQRVSATPPEMARLMAELAGPARTVLDPACGTGELLLAARAQTRSPVRLLGQDVDPDTARLTGLRLTLRAADAAISPGDAITRDAFPGVQADAVLCDPPFHERVWGHEELAADPRWTYGTPPKAEPELAWVQHTLTHLAPGGLAVVLMPAVAAARRSGRRIRAELLRRGALRAVLAFAPNHVWLLRRPESAPATVLMAESADRAALVRAWQEYGDDPDHDEPGISRAVPVIDLLDEEVDLTPGRHLPAAAPAETAAGIAKTHERLISLVGDLRGLVPPVQAAHEPQEPEVVPVSELARIGHLAIHQAPLRRDSDDTGEQGEAAYTAEDIAEGRPASGRITPGERWIPVLKGDVVVTATGVARVIEESGPLLGPQLTLLRPDPALLDPYFLAGVLRSAGNIRASALQTTGGRADVRRARVPRLPPAEQRRYGAAFRRMAAFESALRTTTVLGTELAQMLADGVAEGLLLPGLPGETH